MPNSIMVLEPYKLRGTWVFDDESTNLREEAFVAGTDTIIDEVTKNIKGAAKGFRLLFGAVPFPGYNVELTWVRADETNTGNWYYCEQTKTEGWLCPSLFKYFPTAPKKIYVEVSQKRK